MNKQMSVIVRGKHHEWAFQFDGDPAHIADWRADGLEVNIIENSIPAWVAELGLARAWCIGQDLLNFRNPWRTE